jgi:hypothetical protein
MSNLASYFPGPLRKAHIKRSLSPSVIIFIHCNFANPPKEKYLILVSIDDGQIFFFVINSKINQFILSNPHLLQAQVQIKKSDYDFLHYDSYIDCSTINTINEDEIIKQIQQDTTRIKGNLNSKTKKDIITAVIATTTLSRYQKKLITNSLSS